MPEVVLQDSEFLDADDTAALLELIRGLGYEAETGESRVAFSMPGWVLVLAWIGNEAGGKAFGALLGKLGREAVKHFRRRDAEPPRFVYLFGPRGEILKSIELDADAEDIKIIELDEEDY